MYKRPAKLTFIATDNELLHLAESLLRIIGSPWLSCDTLLLNAEPAIPSSTAIDSDLIILLQQADTPPITYSGCIPYRSWELAGDLATIEQGMRQQLASMVAGMRMLSRLDATE